MSRLSTLLVCLALTCGMGCAQSSGDDRARASLARTVEGAASAPAPTRASAPSRVVRRNPTRILATSGSAYGVTLTSAEDGNYLLTGNAAYRWVPGETPARRAEDFGFGYTLTAGHFVYWSNGAVRRLATNGGDATTIARVRDRPQRFVSSGDDVAWLERTLDGRFAIHTLDGSKPRLVHTTAGYVGTLAMETGRIYFAERAPDRSWRLGVVPRSGGTAHYGKPKRGRLPAMLVLAESLYYYDGPSSSVLRVAPDLESEEVLARDVICSPMAVAESVYCAQPAGLIEVSIDGGVRRVFPIEGTSAITAVAATATELMWVSDIGEDQFAVDSIPLTPSETP